MISTNNPEPGVKFQYPLFLSAPVAFHLSMVVLNQAQVVLSRCSFEAYGKISTNEEGTTKGPDPYNIKKGGGWTPIMARL